EIDFQYHLARCTSRPGCRLLMLSLRKLRIFMLAVIVVASPVQAMAQGEGGHERGERDAKCGDEIGADGGGMRDEDEEGEGENEELRAAEEGIEPPALISAETPSLSFAFGV